MNCVVIPVPRVECTVVEQYDVYQASHRRSVLILKNSTSNAGIRIEYRRCWLIVGFSLRRWVKIMTRWVSVPKSSLVSPRYETGSCIAFACDSGKWHRAKAKRSSLSLALVPYQPYVDLAVNASPEMLRLTAYRLVSTYCRWISLVPYRNVRGSHSRYFFFFSANTPGLQAYKPVCYLVLVTQNQVLSRPCLIDWFR